MLVICENAKNCKEDCWHKVKHQNSSDCMTNPCSNDDGIKDSKCIEYKEKPMIQKLETTEDQTAKADAGKLRYDLIPGELLNNIQYDQLFMAIPGVMTVKLLDQIISSCITVLGGYQNFLRELAKVYTFGCQKYSEKSWQTVPNGKTRYEAGMFRHIDAFKRGEYVNWEDGGCLHIAQVTFNALAVKWFMLQEK